MSRFGFLVILAAMACSGASPPIATPPAPPTPAATHTTLAAIGVDPTWLDRTAAPCDDFYRFACGGFLDHAEIPADLPSWRPATQMRAANESFLHDLLERARTAPASEPVLHRLGAFYNACMDEPAIDAAGLTRSSRCSTRSRRSAIGDRSRTRSSPCTARRCRCTSGWAAFRIPPIRSA